MTIRKNAPTVLDVCKDCGASGEEFDLRFVKEEARCDDCYETHVYELQEALDRKAAEDAYDREQGFIEEPTEFYTERSGRRHSDIYCE